MSRFATNPIHFSTDCALPNAQCAVVRENFLFLDNGKEHIAIDNLQRKCGNVVIVPDTADNRQSWLYHTSCERMTDVVNQIFQDNLEEPASLSQPASEMMVGELYGRCVTMSYADCKAKVEGFRF